eukprot:TRINITY_DN1395_c0_g1_i1.p4 TRINITY_DN1395_c0_g1~~TRINITY_DN1395_c0_g1_i1.p4  ORF type:complete len:152 (-),score=48.38 TRINITY_DN1395_c0_g1_i1:3093-3491(-)
MNGYKDGTYGGPMKGLMKGQVTPLSATDIEEIANKIKKDFTMKKILLTTALLATAVFANPYAKCVPCHGANGEKVALGKSKVINTMTKSEIIEAMNGYKDGTYGGPMKGLMKGQVTPLSATDIEEIANKIGK